nr:MAG TPA: hypothetical protein [Caudoviricetes sp.]
MKLKADGSNYNFVYLIVTKALYPDQSVLVHTASVSPPL